MGPPRSRIPDGADPIATVDRAVRAVLAERLGGPRTWGDPGCVDFPERLLSLRQAEALPPGTRFVRIDVGTIITPLAFDLLKRRGIGIRLASAGGLSAASRGEWAFAVGVESDGGVVQALRRAWLDDSPPWSELEPSLAAVTGWLVEEPDRGAMLLTSQPAVAVWRACQAPGVRAAAASEPAEVRRAAEGLGMNLLVVDPAGKSISWLKQLAAAFRRNGPPRTPVGLLEEAMR